MTHAIRPDRVATLPPRERILDAAEELFEREGIKNVTVQAIAERASTTKMAVYRHFDTKDALVVEWLRIRAATYRAAFDAHEAAHPDDPRAQITGIARWVADRLGAASHRGCVFVNSIAELPDPQHPARRLIAEHKRAQARRLVELCTRAGVPDPEQVAAELTFLLEGAEVTAQNGSIEEVGDRLVRMVGALLQRS
ncbi:transcriptional regulator, TetR family [Kribbella flavida DSM 17836]|uniref:Transcriptional regulator, TetR family n=1 Tax=Kribbella flavida (strain DSM 17836 / JCM 10339 / NBRC 14399) TaxID=479435 RepID=D2PSE7_KRIFD|nr:TetR/AcrR family transcriptional regulator [Kribbella flavida]ADB33085.1 transcriptional regulator, TetR family [Kribbella flavida DSM 17836]